MKKHYFLKLNPPRTTFAQDMTAEENKIMQRHVIYWKELMDKGIVIAFGPVFDPACTYGIGIIEIADEALLHEIQMNDPALKAGNKYETYPMRAITAVAASTGN